MQVSGTVVKISWRGKTRLRCILVLAAILIAAALYLWQVEYGWADESRIGLVNVGLSVRGFLAGRSPSARDLRGTGLGADARATLYFYDRGSNGVMQVQDLPVLPASQTFELWCIDDAGNIDASSLFRVPVEGQEADVIEVSAPHMMSSYVRFLITIEPVDGGPSPSKQVVLAD